MNGLLLVDKPIDWTSFDVVAKIRGVLRNGGTLNPKVGHSGTLDPKASGLLIILIGTYTKQADKFLKLDKTYQATLFLGKVSTTADEEGEMTIVSDRRPSSSELVNVLMQFEGEQQQVPPTYSAIKVNGQRAYKLARQGIKVDLKPRLVRVYHIKLSSFHYPEVNLNIKVSSGTFIRSLAEDIGKALGTGAYLKRLMRTEVGKYNVSTAIDPENISFEQIEEHLQTE